MSYTDYNFKANVLSQKTAGNHLSEFADGDVLFLKDKGLPIPADKVGTTDSVDKGKIPIVNANGGYELLPNGKIWQQFINHTISTSGTRYYDELNLSDVCADFSEIMFEIYTPKNETATGDLQLELYMKNSGGTLVPLYWCQSAGLGGIQKDYNITSVFECVKLPSGTTIRAVKYSNGYSANAYPQAVFGSTNDMYSNPNCTIVGVKITNTEAVYDAFPVGTKIKAYWR